MIENSKELALQARRLILQMTHDSKASHVGSSLSVVDILASLYSNKNRVDQILAESNDRDVIILSKGHGAAALYSVLSLQGLIPSEWLNDYCADGSKIGGHVTSKNVPSIELSTGSLGHGFPYGVGMALGKKKMNYKGKVFVIISDGECDEGTTWESALLANQFKLDNLVVIVDRNRIQSLGDTESTLQLEPLPEKFSSFGWGVIRINGHDHDELLKSMGSESDGPMIVIAETIKGFGVSFMENKVLWHYKWPNSEQLTDALSELRTNK